MFGLRMREGVARDLFSALDRRLNELEDLGLACIRDGRVCLTPRGKLVADSVAGMFV
jgi:coproporphyrinogen III oxidase-like Fe-S oxidoreductase